jgi:hypothetical protein
MRPLLSNVTASSPDAAMAGSKVRSPNAESGSFNQNSVPNAMYKSELNALRDWNFFATIAFGPPAH